MTHVDHHTAPSVLIIGTDASMLSPTSEVRKRVCGYASFMRELHVLVLGASRRVEGEQVDGGVRLWATGSASRVRSVFEGYLLARRIMERSTIDIISTQDPFETALIGHLARRGTATSLQLQEHGDFFSHTHWRRERLLHRLRYAAGSLLIREADCFRVVSERIAQTLVRRGVRREQIAIAPLLTNCAAFAEALPDPAISVLRPEGGVLILSMARFVPQKNLSFLMRSFAQSIRRGLNARLVLMGTGPLTEQLIREAHTYNAEFAHEFIVVKGWTADPAGAMRAADIYALSSNYEGWGRVAIEALAARTPLIMTDVGCAGEVVKDGINGIVVPVGDETAFSDALFRVGKDPALRDALVKGGVETVQHMGYEEDSSALYRKSLECCIVSPHEAAEQDA